MTHTDDAWSKPRTVEHTFTTGRTATLRTALPMSELIRTGVWDDDLADAFDQALDARLKDRALATRLNDSIVMAMFVDPRIVPDDQVDVEKRCYPIGVLDEAELDETIAAAFGGPATTAAFPADDPDAADSVDSSNVPDSAVADAGVGTGKSRRSRARPKGGAAAERRRSSAA